MHSTNSFDMKNSTLLSGSRVSSKRGVRILDIHSAEQGHLYCAVFETRIRDSNPKVQEGETGQGRQLFIIS